MIDPDQVYPEPNLPTRRELQKMWQVIRKTAFRRSPAVGFSFDLRSFVLGGAAVLVLAFAVIGVFSTFRQFVEQSRPEPVRIGAAYESAIRQFERVVTTVNSQAEQSGARKDRRVQIALLDNAIGELKQEMNGGDISPTKMTRLRQLYSRKLRLLQEMVEQGDIEL